MVQGYYFCIMFEDKNAGHTQLQELGEFGLIAHLTRNLPISQPSTHKGVGDDAAVVEVGGKHLCITTDMLVEGVHFDLGFTPLKHLGYKAVVVNISDVCAMNLKPAQLTVSVAVSNRFTLEAMEALYEGVALASGTYKADVVGGDTVSSNKGLIISVTALGMGTPEEVVYRSGARPNDLLVVSGDLGAAYMGLQVLRREQEIFQVNPRHKPDLEPYQYLVERQLKPEARTDVVDLLKALGVRPTAMIDISDGLSSEILHICRSSGVGCNLFEDKIPLDPMVISSCEEFGLDSSLAALSGGEDYELLFTVSQEDYPKIKGNPNLTVIGHMTPKEEGVHMIGRGGNRIPITAQGWNAFGGQG